MDIESIRRRLDDSWSLDLDSDVPTHYLETTTHHLEGTKSKVCN